MSLEIMLATGISTLQSQRRSCSMVHPMLPAVVLLFMFSSYYTIGQPAHSPLHKLSIPACNARFKDRHYPIDLPAAVPPESEEVEQPIIIEHKSLEELNQLGPYAFPVISSLPSLPCLLRITKKCFSSSADVLYLFFLYPQASGFHCTVQITSVPEDNSWWLRPLQEIIVRTGWRWTLVQNL